MIQLHRLLLQDLMEPHHESATQPNVCPDAKQKPLGRSGYNKGNEQHYVHGRAHRHEEDSSLEATAGQTDGARKGKEAEFLTHT